MVHEGDEVDYALLKGCPATSIRRFSLCPASTSRDSHVRYTAMALYPSIQGLTVLYLNRLTKDTKRLGRDVS